MHELARAVLMVRPEGFAFNVEAALDNSYMRPGVANPTQAALTEFERAVRVIRDAGVEVVELEGTSQHLPDAVFPNNWFATSTDGLVIVFPMKHPSRRRETEQLPAALTALARARFEVEGVLRLDLTGDSVLEGTGSLVIDSASSTLYAALSPRTESERLASFARLRGYRHVETFRAEGKEGEAIYHTNVMMGLGRGFAVICPESISDPSERRRVLEKLGESRELIPISRQEMNQSFAGNLIGLESAKGHQVILLSHTALRGLSSQGRKSLENHGALCPIDIPTIEAIGGGSARCMVAEIFLRKK